LNCLTVDLCEESLKLMIEEIIDRVRTCRNNKVKAYSEKHVVLEYFQQHHSIELSDRKYQFLSREIKNC